LFKGTHASEWDTKTPVFRQNRPFLAINKECNVAKKYLTHIRCIRGTATLSNSQRGTSALRLDEQNWIIDGFLVQKANF